MVKFEFFIRDFPGKKIKWKKFLKGFLWTIEAGRKILKGYPLFHTRSVFFFPREKKNLTRENFQYFAREVFKLAEKKS